MISAGQLELLVPFACQLQAVESILVHVAVVQVVELNVEFGVLRTVEMPVGLAAAAARLISRIRGDRGRQLLRRLDYLIFLVLF